MKAYKRKFLNAMQERTDSKSNMRKRGFLEHWPLYAIGAPMVGFALSLVPARQRLLTPYTAVYQTPPQVTDDIARFAKTINANETLEYVPLEVWPASVANYCTANVQSKVAQSGGTVVNGWSIWIVEGAFLYAEAHVIWRSPEGKLVDITPRVSPFKPKFGRILFLPDASVDLLEKGFVEGKTKILDNADAADVQNYLNFIKDCYASQQTYWAWQHTLPPESEIKRLYLKYGFEYPF